MDDSATAMLLSWKNLKYYAATRSRHKKCILDGISGTAYPRRLLAVLGESGSGKTTFLNAVSARLLVDSTHTFEGEISINSSSYGSHSENIAFVTQDDVLFDTATPEEALYFSARVRAGLSKYQARQRTKEVLHELMLTNVKDVFLGTAGYSRGVSGGERKRTNIAVELITDPKILLLDEPTSGLDSFTAFRCVQTIQALARKGRTVVCTIHQPSAEIFELFDDLMLIASGTVIYHGPALRSLDYFASMGYKCPSNFTPTDYFMALMQNEEIKLTLINAWNTCMQAEQHVLHQVSVKYAPLCTSPKNAQGLPGHPSLSRASLWVQFSELAHRALRNNYRNRYLLFTQLGQSTIFGIFVGLVFCNLGVDQTSVQDRLGLFFVLSTNAAFAGAGNVINTFTVEKSVFIKEQRSSAYSPLCYFLGKTIGELPFGLVNPGVLISIVYYISGLTRNFSTFLLVLGTMLLGYQSGASFGLFLGAICPNFFVSSALLPLVLVPLSLAGGIAVSSSRIRKYWTWLEHISTIRITFISLAKLEFSRISQITCDNIKYHGRCASMYQTGMDVLQNFGYASQSRLWTLLVSILCIIVILRAGAVIALYRLSREKI